MRNVIKLMIIYFPLYETTDSSKLSNSTRWFHEGFPQKGKWLLGESDFFFNKSNFVKKLKETRQNHVRIRSICLWNPWALPWLQTRQLINIPPVHLILDTCIGLHNRKSKNDTVSYSSLACHGQKMLIFWVTFSLTKQCSNIGRFSQT